LLPRTHGFGYDVIHVVVAGALGGVIAAALVIAAVFFRGVARARRDLQP
jgi:hypothetical protein